MAGIPDRVVYTFKKGILVISDPGEQMAVRSWPDPAARKRLWHNKWQSFQPEFQLIQPYRRPKRKAIAEDPNQLELTLNCPRRPPPFPDEVTGKAASLKAFRFSLPRELANAIEQFRSHQWSVIIMAHLLEEPTLELLHTNPVLAYALANTPAYRSMFKDPKRREKAGRVLSWKQRKILKRLGFPDTKAMVNLSKKLRLPSVSPDRLTALRCAIADRGIEDLLSHLTDVNAGVLGLVTNAKLAGTFSPKLLHSVSASRREDYYPFTAHMLEELLQMYRAARLNQPIPVFQTIKRVHDCHHELAAEFVRLSSKEMKPCHLPEPPIHGTDEIVPITTFNQLLQEGRDQHNCVGGYGPRIEQGGTYIYKVLAPQRATLSIIKSPGGTWSQGELKMAGNRPANPATKRAVDDWLATHTLFA